MTQDIPISVLFMGKCGKATSYFNVENFTTDAELYDFNGLTKEIYI